MVKCQPRRGHFGQAVSRGFMNTKAPLRGFDKRATLSPGFLRSPGAKQDTPAGVKKSVTHVVGTKCYPCRRYKVLPMSSVQSVTHVVGTQCYPCRRYKVLPMSSVQSVTHVPIDTKGTPAGVKCPAMI